MGLGLSIMLWNLTNLWKLSLNTQHSVDIMHVCISVCMYELIVNKIINQLWGTESQPEFSNTDLRLCVRGALRSIYLFYNPFTVNNLKVYVHILVTELTNIPHNLSSSYLYFLSCKEKCITSNQQTILEHLPIIFKAPWETLQEIQR